ncbi:unnamed protein product [Cuscuta epithymum]|uniref:Uncharacterized protein n=1 Tax=Cuscuta epithymum TaxID=186058 RepID=A0AAV0EZI2_9ASTE|nr:unnamed protein product [Cuscuta epithymum]CAH9128632.1 unnamed protein product [Cuscuta epithymum]
MIRSPIQLTKPMFEIEIPKKWSYVLLKTKVSTCVSILPSAAVSSPRKSFHYFQFAIKVVLSSESNLKPGMLQVSFGHILSFYIARILLKVGCLFRQKSFHRKQF